jgi:aminopeptidase N
MESLRIFNRRFGPYPYTEFDVAATFTSAAGVEYPGLIVIADRYYEGGHYEWVVAHEVAHQWWYNVVGNDQVDDPWVDEAITQYSSVLYFEDRYGVRAAAQARQEGLVSRWDSAREAGRDRAVAGPVASFAIEDYGAIVYGKGPLFFHALREEIGDSRFFEFMRVYFQEHRYGIATPESLLAVAETVSGQNLDDLYSEWILSPPGE